MTFRFMPAYVAKPIALNRCLLRVDFMPSISSISDRMIDHVRRNSVSVSHFVPVT